MEDVKKLTPKQERAIHLMVYEEKNREDTCKEIKVNRSTLFRWFLDASFCTKYDAEIKRKHSVLAVESLNGIVDLARNSEKDSVKLNAWIRINDMAGYKPTEKIENTGNIPSFNFIIAPVEPNKGEE